MNKTTSKSLSQQASKPASQQASQWRVDISILRIVTTIFVVFSHTNSTLTDNRELFQLTESQYIFYLCAYRALYWAVPVFLMITGALLLKRNKKITYDICLKKYCIRIMLALFIFGVPFSMMMIFMESRHLSLMIVLQAVMNVIQGKSFGHLWYLYALMGIYLILPFIKSATDNMDRKTMRTFLIVLFLLNFCIPLIERLADTEIAFFVPLTTFSIFYVACGYYLDEYVDIDRKIAVLGFVGLIFLIIVVAIVSGNGKYLDYDSPIIGTAAICLFLAFKGVHGKRNKNMSYATRLWNIDRLCFGVYLIHPVFIHFTYRVLKVTPVLFNTYRLMVFIFGVVFVIFAFTGSWIMSKIKLLKIYVL